MQINKVGFHQITIGSKVPEVINAVIEIPKGSQNKIEWDEHMDALVLDRVLHSPMFYPLDYGFVPETRSEDGDHLDVMVVSSGGLFPGAVMAVRPIGAIDMEDESGQDWKIIAVAAKDPRFEEIHTLEDLGAHFQKEVQHFFEQYKHLENKWVKLKGWLGKEESYRLIKEAQDRFAEEK